MPIVRFLASRLGLAAITLFLISAITFFATNVVPNDPARVALGKFATEAQLEAYRDQQGLDEPVLGRYLGWLGDVVQGDWGTSPLSQQPVEDQVVPRISRSLALALAAMLIAVPLAFVLGVYAGQRGGTRTDLTITLSALFVNSLPEFVVGLTLLVVLAVQLGWFPIESSGAAVGVGMDEFKAYVLPVLTLAIVLTPYMARMVRANVRDTLSQPFVRSAVLRGVPRRSIVWRHVVPNASLPVVNVVALSMAELIGGVVVIETVFGFPGIGKLLVDSVSSKDIPTVQVITLVMAAGYVLLNLAADLAVLLLNPRLRAAR
jgi:peptide/nickel transport system permease protein